MPTFTLSAAVRVHAASKSAAEPINRFNEENILLPPLYYD
jgi:hypothetical protein